MGASVTVCAAGSENCGFGELVVSDARHRVGAQLHGGRYRCPDLVRIGPAQLAAAGAEQVGRLGEGLGQAPSVLFSRCVPVSARVLAASRRAVTSIGR